MERVIFTVCKKDISYVPSTIKIDFTKDMTPNEAAEFLVKELKHWNNISLCNLKKITIE